MGQALCYGDITADVIRHHEQAPPPTFHMSASEAFGFRLATVVLMEQVCFFAGFSVCSFGDFLSADESVGSVFGAGDTISPLLSITMATGEALKHLAQPCGTLGLLHFHHEIDVIRVLNVCEQGHPYTFGSMAGLKIFASKAQLACTAQYH